MKRSAEGASVADGETGIVTGAGVATTGTGDVSIGASVTVGAGDGGVLAAPKLDDPSVGVVGPTGYSPADCLTFRISWARSDLAAPLSPAMTPSMSASERFWLSLNFASIRSISTSTPTIARSWPAM